MSHRSRWGIVVALAVATLCWTASAWGDDWDKWKDPNGVLRMYEVTVDAREHTRTRPVFACEVQVPTGTMVALVMVVNPEDQWGDSRGSADFRGFTGERGSSGENLQLWYANREHRWRFGGNTSQVLSCYGSTTTMERLYLYCEDESGYGDNVGRVRVRVYVFPDYEQGKRFSTFIRQNLPAKGPVAVPNAPPEDAGSAPKPAESSDEPFTEQSPEFGPEISASPFGARRSSIHGLVVQDTEAGFIGSRMEILAVVAPHSGDGRGRLMRSVGQQMTTSFEEALRTVRVDHPRWEPGEVQVSFDDKYTPKDGGSAGAAFTVLISSLLEGFEIDPGFAMTGDITVDGKVRKVGAVGAKVRGATRGGATVVAVPIDNAQDVIDLAVLEGVDSVLGAQVIAVRTLAEAKALARTDREGEWAEAIELFAGLQKSIGGGSWRPSLGDVATLEKVMELCPQHLSADLALQSARNQLPRTLSAAASINEAFVAIRPIWPDVLEEKLRGRTLDRQTMSDVRVRLRRVQVMADARARDLVNSVAAYASRVEQASRRGLSNDVIRRINQTLRDIAAEAQALDADRELIEELLQ